MKHRAVPADSLPLLLGNRETLGLGGIFHDSLATELFCSAVSACVVRSPTALCVLVSVCLSVCLLACLYEALLIGLLLCLCLIP